MRGDVAPDQSTDDEFQQRSIAWSLEGEICRLGRSTTLGEALKKLNLLNGKDGCARIALVRDWHRSGAETYLLRFQVIELDCSPNDMVLKACVALSPGSAPDDTIQRWIQRRTDLNAAAVRSPRLVAWGGG